MKSISKEITEGKIRYAFAVSEDTNGKPCLYAIRQCFSQKSGRYVNDIEGKDEHGPVARPVSLEQANGILASGLEGKWSMGNG